MRVRRTLSESEIEKYGIVAQSLLINCVVWYTTTIPIAMLLTLASRIAASLRT